VAAQSIATGFEPEVEVPEGWTWDDPWSCLLPTVAGGGQGGQLEDDLIKAFQAATFEMNAIPSIPPPVELRA
jgi:nucleoporin NUP42